MIHHQSIRAIARFASILLLILCHLFCLSRWADAQEAWPVIQRRLPPLGIEIEAATLQRLEARLAAIERRCQAQQTHDREADVAVLAKAVRWAIRFQEFYRKEDVNKAERLLELAEQRLASLEAQQTPWTQQTGRVVLGYRSRIDDSLQPYGLEIPETYDATSPMPLYVWLHGRGDQATDMHFLEERLNRKGTIQVPDALIVHPFGRHCIGFKHAGEIDVLEVVEQVQQRYSIDPRRIVLIGFSMGGAGAWHVGAHYTDRWSVICPGAGFAETARYINLAPADFPADYEQALWQVYDVPNYTRNVFNRPVIAYSGEIDRQIQAAQVMEQAFEEQGHRLEHLIGPNTAHQYHPDTLKMLLERIRNELEKVTTEPASRISIQTPTLRYSRFDWLQATALQRHWTTSRIDAERMENHLRIQTTNIAQLQVADERVIESIEIDGQTLRAIPDQRPLVLSLKQSQWQVGQSLGDGLRKIPGLQGPIDDAFLDPFLLVKPSRPCAHPQVQRWVDAELAHFEQRWQTLFRGELRTKFDHEVTKEDEAKYHLIVWGDPEANLYLQRVIAELPLEWTSSQLNMRQAGWSKEPVDSRMHVPVMIYPNPAHANRYLVLNSGPTFREDHDRTNSLQNPKLPDWALLDLSQPPSGTAPARVIDAGFFDEAWRLEVNR